MTVVSGLLVVSLAIAAHGQQATIQSGNSASNSCPVTAIDDLVNCYRTQDQCNSDSQCPGLLTCCKRPCGHRCICPLPACSPTCADGQSCRWRRVDCDQFGRNCLTRAVCVPVPAPVCQPACPARQRCLWRNRVAATLLPEVQSSAVCTAYDVNDLVEDDEQDDCFDDDEGLHAILLDDDDDDFYYISIIRALLSLRSATNSTATSQKRIQIGSRPTHSRRTFPAAAKVTAGNELGRSTKQRNQPLPQQLPRLDDFVHVYKKFDSDDDDRYDSDDDDRFDSDDDDRYDSDDDDRYDSDDDDRFDSDERFDFDRK